MALMIHGHPPKVIAYGYPFGHSLHANGLPHALKRNPPNQPLDYDQMQLGYTFLGKLLQPFYARTVKLSVCSDSLLPFYTYQGIVVRNTNEEQGVTDFCFKGEPTLRSLVANCEEVHIEAELIELEEAITYFGHFAILGKSQWKYHRTQFSSEGENWTEINTTPYWSLVEDDQPKRIDGAFYSDKWNDFVCHGVVKAHQVEDKLVRSGEMPIPKLIRNVHLRPHHTATITIGSDRVLDIDSLLKI